MPKTITRRDVLKFVGGSVLGTFLTPIPWKLLDDTAIWTQNWSLTPPLSHGPISNKFSVCTLCPAGCAVKARCVAGMPYMLSGVAHHPLSQGILCPRGLAGHHLSFHPYRLTVPHKFFGKDENSRLSAIVYDKTSKEISKHIIENKGSVVLLDRQPGRIISSIYDQFIKNIPNGRYVTFNPPEESTLLTLQKITDTSTPLGYDFEYTKMILSFGTPLLDGWGTPGRLMKIFREKKENGIKLIQVEHRQSRTALQADTWIPVQPGREGLFALTLANILISEKLVPQNIIRSINNFQAYKIFIEQFAPELTCEKTGIAAGVARKIALELIQSTPSIACSGSDPGGGPFDEQTEQIIAELNLLLGNVGRTGGIVAKRDVPGYKNPSASHTNWKEIPDHSVQVLIIDSADSGYAFPWDIIEQKLIPTNNVVISLSPFLNEIAAHADYIIPSAVYYETQQDIIPSSSSSVASFSVSFPLNPKRKNTIDNIDFIKNISKELGIPASTATFEELLKEKVSAIYSSRRGLIFTFSDGQSKRTTEIQSADDLWKTFTEGATWVDDPIPQHTLVKFSLNTNYSHKAFDVGQAESLILVPYGWRGTVTTSQISPIMSKVFQESELRSFAGTVSINPMTASKLNLQESDTAFLKTEKGEMNVRIKIDNAVRPGLIEAAVGPNLNGVDAKDELQSTTVLDLCKVQNNGTWKITKATLSKAYV
ncbi:MAG: molybdopterin-dependent oxidoreductase [Bacteroidota bacterium]|nr:molybdopterin-dependent oxidoreductase [Bacteroidota bacterium]